MALPVSRKDPLPVADLRIKVNGMELPRSITAHLSDVSVNNKDGQASQFTIKLHPFDDRRHKVAVVDEEILAPGVEVEIRMGYLGNLTSVIEGEVTQHELTLSAGEPATLTITGYDLLHRLGRGDHSATFKQRTDAQIATKIARDNNFRIQATSGPADPVHELITQKNESDLAFLQWRAQVIGYEVVLEGKTVHFRPPPERPVLTLSADTDLLDFSATRNPSNLYGGVVVRGVDKETKKKIKAIADVPARASGDRLFGSSRLVLNEERVRNQQEAVKLAEAKRDEMLLTYLSGSATSFGHAPLRAGQTLRIEGVGTSFSGDYSLESVTHSISAGGGFRSSLELKGGPR